MSQTDDRVRRPLRVERTYVQTLSASPERVFPYLCPVREREWVEGWDPRYVISESGYAELDCAFATPAVPQDAVWVVTRHEPETFDLEMVKVTPGHTVGRISIALSESEPGRTAARVTYRFTAIGPAGEPAVREFTEEHYQRFMQTWEAALNARLQSETAG